MAGRGVRKLLGLPGRAQRCFIPNREEGKIEVENLPKIKMIVKAGKTAFHVSRAKGDMAKALVRTLLETADYTVLPFGYESYFTHIKDLVHTGRVEKTGMVHQIRTMPDFVVLDESPIGNVAPEKVGIEFVEVKFSGREPNLVGIDTSKIEGYRKYWPHSTLIYVLPRGKDVFYAKPIRKIKPSSNNITDLKFGEDDRIEFYFPRISSFHDELDDLKKIAKNAFAKL